MGYGLGKHRVDHSILGVGEGGSPSPGGITFDGSISEGDICKRSGESTIGKVTQISEMLIVAKHTLATFTNTAGTREFGETLNNFNFSWTYNRNSDNPTSQEIDQGIGSIASSERTLAVTGAGLVNTTTFTISAVGDDTNTSSLTSNVNFRWKRYWGVWNITGVGGSIPDNAQILANFSSEFGTSRLVTKTFDASGGPYNLVIVYPVSWGAPVTVKVNGFVFTDYTLISGSFTNASGGTANYYMLYTNNQTSGSSVEVQIAA